MTKKVIVRYDRSPDSSFMVHLCVGNSCWNAVQTEKNLLGCIWRSQTTIRRGNFDWHALKQCYTTLQSLWKWQIQYSHKSTHLLCTNVTQYALYVWKFWGHGGSKVFFANEYSNCHFWAYMNHSEIAVVLELSLHWVCPPQLKTLERLLGWI